jgi:hypothetical protein
MGPRGLAVPSSRLPALARVCAITGAALACLIAAPGARAAGITVDGSVNTHQSTASASITSGPLSTTNANDLLVAFIASDGPNAANGQSFTSVSGGGLTWKLRERTNAQPGTAEVWEAVASTALSNVTVTATRASGSYVGSISVVAFAGADTSIDGAVGSGNATTGAPTATLTTIRAGSWVWGVGNDWDAAKSRTVGAGQTKFDEFLAPVGDTYWVQSQTAAGNSAKAPVTINDTAPTTDRWDLSTIEILPAGPPDTTPPTAPTGLAASAPNANQVSLTWSPSNDNVGVIGYNVLRNGQMIGGSVTTSYTDFTVSPSTQYSYTVEAFDAAGNISQASDPATVTTPAPSTNPPVISAVASSNVTQTNATITWTTDIPSSSQVLYGTSSSYDHNTTLDSTQVTSHSQTITGLTAGTTYHFAVQSTGSASNTSTSGDNTFTTAPNDITLPDMQIKVPTDQISVTIDGVSGHRQLQYTHITWDAGAGPFEIDPHYNSQTGTATFTQAIYKSDSPGKWTLDHSVPVAVTGQFDPPSDYQFPLTSFTLNNVNGDGSLGTAVATSPKTDYCITGDTFVGGVPNTPNTTFIPVSNCNNPNAALGWSVGWGDEYDQTDPGQPIDLTGVPDGTYILHAVVDPKHVLTESDAGNNVTDTKLRIQGNTVTVLAQTNPGTTPPTVAMTNPADGSNASGTVEFDATASATAPASITSVQFLLDGLPLGNAVTSAPYKFNWTVGSTTLGPHTLAARATDSNGDVSTSQAITVNVVSGNGGGGGTDNTPPTVSIINPTAGQIISGTIPVAANAMDNVAVASVQFFLDGKPLGNPDTSSPYAVSWDTTTATNGAHVLSAQATDTSGNVGTSPDVSVTVQNPALPPPCFIMDVHVNVHGTGAVTTPSFHTAVAGETLLAFVSSDGPAGAGKQTATVSGAGLTWTLVKRENARSGDSEVWKATAPSVLSGATVKSTPAKAGYAQSLSVIAMQGTNGVGASAVAAGANGPPTVNLTTTEPKSLVFAVGNDWDRAAARTLPVGWTMLDQFVNTSSGDTFWSQYTNQPTGAAGSVVVATDTAPTNDQWNMVAVELVNDDS